MAGTRIQGREKVAFRTAELLLEIEAVQFMDEMPFILASGLPSPVYIDCRKIISFPNARSEIVDFMAESIRSICERSPLDNLAGGETAGIPFAAFAADRLSLPMCYVRKKPKGYGRNARIEGNMGPGDSVLLVEDLATDGGSKLSFVRAIRKTGAKCEHALVIFYYGIFPEAEVVLSDNGITLHYLCNWFQLVEMAKKMGALAPHAIREVGSFLEDPRKWQSARSA